MLRIPSTTRLGALALPLFCLAACANFDAVRDFGKSASAASAAYPQAALAYVDSAAVSAPYLAAGGVSLVAGAARRSQVDDALAVQDEVSRYFAMLARLAGDDAFGLTNLKALGADVQTLRGGGFDRATVDAYASLGKTLARFAVLPAEKRAVKSLVQDGGPSAMRLVAALRSTSADWRAEVSNDAKQVDATLEIGVLPADVPPLLRMLATDRRAALSTGYAATLRRLRAADTALAAVERAHADMAEHLDDLESDALRQRLRGAAAELRGLPGGAGMGPDPAPGAAR